MVEEVYPVPEDPMEIRDLQVLKGNQVLQDIRDLMGVRGEKVLEGFMDYKDPGGYVVLVDLRDQKAPKEIPVDLLDLLGDLGLQEIKDH